MNQCPTQARMNIAGEFVDDFLAHVAIDEQSQAARRSPRLGQLQGSYQSLSGNLYGVRLDFLVVVNCFLHFVTLLEKFDLSPHHYREFQFSMRLGSLTNTFTSKL